MVKITEEGTIPEERKPWYLDQEMVCPNCQTKFRLDADDFATGATAIQQGIGGWALIPDNEPKWPEQISGPCPFCGRSIRIERESPQQSHLAKKAALYANVRDSLPADVNGVRWAKERGVKSGHFGRPGPKVVAIPTKDGGPMVAQYGDALIHIIRRVDGQIRTDTTALWGSFWEAWEEASEAEASVLDQELVDFVQRLRLVKSTMAQVAR